MKFWDSSALVPLLVRQPTSERLEGLLRRDPAVVIWWGGVVECASALARLQREGTLPRSGLRQAQQVLDHLRARAFEVEPVEEVRARALRLLAVHQLRAADSLQLAAALIWCRERPQRVAFVCLDDRLRLAAAGEGFQV
ncbi:MAG TPA: type II toxin-antitoxin system VapC family toxin, partial [Acidimicrobiia bacterium]|nr:type II toxin-antitoxin system VapC family toxin [Acidimicrobiia bacterium]